MKVIKAKSRGQVKVTVKVPFLDGKKWASEATYGGKCATYVHGRTKSQLLNKARIALELIGQTEGDGLAGGVIIILRHRAMEEEDL